MNKKSVISIILFTVLAILLGCSSKGKKEQLYDVKIRGAGNVIVKQASACINLCRSYVTTWEYARVTGTDFKTASAQLQGTEVESLKKQFEESKSEINKLLEDLANPPLKYIEAHEKLIELNDIYSKIHSLVMNPSGSMESFNDSINELQNKLVEKKNELDSTLSF